MENENYNESQELSIQELASISGGVAIGEVYQGGPPDNKYNNLYDAIAKHLEGKNFPYWSNDKPKSVEPDGGIGN
ncbi:bacteriocin [Calothrix sp. FACHB-156]|nr:bacteriocin [Calothrix sp. FACHB-156]